MDKNNRLKQKHSKLQRSKRSIQEDETMKTFTDVQVNKENGNVPQNNHEVKISGHSTPVRKKNDSCINNIEDSPEPDYTCSPIICTQDGGNDVAWDWQNSHSKSSNSRRKIQNTIETPKRTKQLQKKRNSNSPLLNKPVKRKLAKVERMESIGKFAAELQALTEKMDNIPKADDINSENEMSFGTDDIESQLMIVSNEKDNERNMQSTSIIETDIDEDHVSDHNVNTTYADLFDDAADDFMVKCSQEVEARLIELSEKTHSTSSSYKSEGKELSVISEKNTHCISVKNSSNESIKSTTSKAVHDLFNRVREDSAGAGTNISHYSVKESCFKVLSRDTVLSSKWPSTGVTENISQSINNNNINNNVSKKVLSEDMFEPFDFPDDSFDDCLATCADNDDKLLSKLDEQTNILLNENNTKSSCGYLTKNSTVTSPDWETKKANVLKTSPQVEINNGKRSIVEDEKAGNCSRQIVNHLGRTNVSSVSSNNEKFFRRKSLSDSFFEQNNEHVDMNEFSLVQKYGKSNVQSESDKSVTSCPLVSTRILPTVQVIRNESKVSTFPNNIDACKMRDVNKLGQKESSKLIVRHHSDTSFNNDIKQIRTSSQPQQCTPAEIERKRQEAKLKLEAKRRLLSNTNRMNTLKEIPPRRPIKR